MQPLIRTSSAASQLQAGCQPKSPLALRILCLLAVYSGSLADLAFAGPDDGPAAEMHGQKPLSSTNNAIDRKWERNGSFQTLECKPKPESVLIRSVGEYHSDAAWNFVIAHGLGGTVPEDRFCQLAIEIKHRNPNANVLLIDWSTTATLTWYGMPRVLHISSCLNRIAADAASALSSLKVDLGRTTLIGESFGVYIQGHVAKSLGGVKHILAFNPANEAGGYDPASLRDCSGRAWSFHTYSVYDTTRQIAHADFLLETPQNASHLAQHTHGIQWLTRLLRAGDSSWLLLDKPVPPACPEVFGGIVLEDGSFVASAVPRIRPSSAEVSTGLEDSSHETLIASSQMMGGNE